MWEPSANQTAPSPAAIQPSIETVRTRSFPVTAPVRGLIRSSAFSLALVVVTQIDPSPSAIDDGESGSGNWSVEEKLRRTRVSTPRPLSSTLTTHAPSASAATGCLKFDVGG